STLARAGRVSAPLARLGVPLEASGLSQSWLLAHVQDAGGPLRLRLGGSGKSGSTGEAPGRPLAPGDAVGARLGQGAIDLTAFGTVTRVDGDRILAFGHPFLQLGPVE